MATAFELRVSSAGPIEWTCAERSPFSSGMISFALTMAGVIALFVLQFGISGERTYSYIACALAPTVPLCFIAATYRSSQTYLFSTGFWLAVTVGFYLVLKAGAMIVDGVGNTIIAPMLSISLFLFGYAVLAGYFGAPRGSVDIEPRGYVVAPDGVPLIIVLIVAFELMAFILAINSGAENTVLKVAAATQNSGAAYLYRIPLLANSLYLIILITAYKYKRHISAAALCTLIVLYADIIASGRSAIIILILWNIYLYNRYVKPVNILYIMIFSPILIFIVVVFGYARAIGIGDLSVLWTSIEYLWNNSDLIIKLFMDRLDMLPQMAKAFALYHVGRLPELDGTSYLYAFLHAIPRNIWPDKPALTAAVLTRVTYPGPFSEGVLIFPSIVVEALMNLGWTGIFIVGVATGGVATAFDRVMVARSVVPMAWAMTFFSFPMGLVVEGFHSNFVANLIYMSTLLGILLVFLRVARIIRPASTRDVIPV